MTDPIFFTGGGTGGHVFPALAVLEELKARSGAKVVWIGSRGGMEGRLLARYDIPFYLIPAGKLRRYFSLRNLLDIFKIAAGIAASLYILLKERPRLVFSKGGYVSVPVVVAASLLGIPVLTHESDIIPGLATRINARFAEKVLVSFADTRDSFRPGERKKIVHTGNPVRRDLLAGSPEAGRKLVGCPPDRFLLLVLGGSQGSAFLNRLVLAALPKLTSSCFVVHQMGEANYRRIELPNYYGAPFFTRQLPDLLAASDLVVCRSGANTVWELAALGKPSLLIPLPRSASRGDQIANARFFVRSGAALMLEEKELDADRLIEILLHLRQNESKLNTMKTRARALAMNDAAGRIAEIIWERSRTQAGGA
jgi:UDP-N-acetylglucosamine--N-acetylmuramyl-(pentapeptide) pyrophosphoryl-undecaprenol N-acetylglucosamine transferase